MKLRPILLGAAVFWSGAASAGDLLARGEYLAHAADCAACHMGAAGALSGGRAFTTPFGTIYAPNLTPDTETGVGLYTDDEWVAALREGVGRGGKHLYPAMPYTSYTQMTRDDALAIKAWVMAQPPVHAQTPANQMSFPFSIRALMIGWNLIYNPDKRFAPDAAHDAAWNRGAYLAEALGHCQQCHTPRDLLQGLETSKPYAGAVAQGWRAYNITSDRSTGIGDWSAAELAAYLRAGHADGRGVASGPMAEAVSYSLRYLTDADAASLAEYIRTIPAIQTVGPTQPAAQAADPLGQRLYAGACASCHRLDGTGAVRAAGALAGDASVADPAGTNVIQMLLHGGELTTETGTAAMPGFAHGYTDADLAALANFAIGQFGQKPGGVTAAAVAKARRAG